MIGMLSGVIFYRQESYVLLDVHGVGYKVLVPAAILSSVKTGDALTIFTHTHVREDILELYGFLQMEDLRLFEYLISVSGVGCKTALGIFSVGDRNAILSAITQGNVSFFTGVPRLGKKNAQKIIIELKGKLGEGGGDLDLSGLGDEGSEALLALQEFGFSQREAQVALNKVVQDGQSTEERIRLALKYLGK